MKEFIDDFLPCGEWVPNTRSLPSKVIKRNRETGVPTPRARLGRPRKTTEREDVICYVCAEMGVLSQQTPFVLGGYGSLIPMYPER